MRIIFLYIILLFTITASAGNEKLSQKQFKKDMDAVKTSLKKGNDLEKSENTLRKYLADSTMYQQKNLHLMLIECLRKQYESGNEKMYLKEKVDTATIVRTAVKMFLAIEAFDSIDAQPNNKGVIDPSYRKKHAEHLMPYWGNILKGGIFFFAHSNWQEAWTSFDTYLDCYRQPLFQETKLDSTQRNFASFLATMSAYNMSDFNKMLKYADYALLYQPTREMTLQRLADKCVEKGDTARYVNYLKTGFNDFPYSGYFFPNLIDYLTRNKDYTQAMYYADMALEKDSLNATFLLARHNINMMTEKYDKALADGLSLLVINDTLAIPNYNVACIYFKKAQEAMKHSGKTYKQRLKAAQSYYKKCIPYMEQYRRLMPNDIQLWRPVLYEAYLNLNMGKEFDSLPPL